MKLLLLILFFTALIACAPSSTAPAAPSITPVETLLSATPSLQPLPTITPTPEVSLLLPYAALVDDSQPGIALVSMDGQVLLDMDAPSDAPFQPGSAHLAGSFSGQGFPPLVYLSVFEDSKAIVVNRFNGLQVYQASAFLTSMVGAPAQPILAVGESFWLKGNVVQNNIFFGTLDEMRSNPSGNVILVDDNGMSYVPMAVTSENGKALGVLFTRSTKGALNPDALFPLQRGLHYFDSSSNTLAQVLPIDRLFCGISPSLTLHASTDPAHLDLRVHNTGRGSYRSLGLDASSDLGAGNVVFSPEDQTVAWMEIGTNVESSTGYATLIKIASVNGTTLHILPSASFDRLVGVTSIRVAPAGFLDADTLLVQVTTDDHQGWLASVGVTSGDITIYHAGVFLAFVYP